MSKSSMNTTSSSSSDKILDKPHAGSETHWERLDTLSDNDFLEPLLTPADR